MNERKTIPILNRLMTAALILFYSFSAVAQKSRDVYVDKNGVMRWGDTNKEVQGFGINYTVPFAYAYRAAKQLNVDHEKAIDNDVYHFARLGFDGFRVHVWDTEISDSTGNLINNEHLRLFDYALMRMKERGIKFILTPIAYWGNGYPEPDEKTPGFAAKYGKNNCLTNEDAIKAQEKYLFQFLNHVNPYTKIAYKDDPDIIAFEVSNEPHHQGTPAEVTTFINRMVAAMRKTGCKKLIFYNVSHNIHLYEAYYSANIQGGTFQWYPTGLGAMHELRGNFLPNVDRYTIPFANHPKVKSAAKIVYEFDAADIGRSYIYPAMARSFREAGIQWAAHFAYDPTYMAYANTEYNTHYMNLVYAPQKALSLKITSEVFHRVPMYKSFGRYPANTTFDVFRVDYEHDLAEMNTDTKFIYTNTTASKPVAPEKLEEVSGFGNSSIVRYEGLGAYFLDKIERGVWRLEVMPDGIWVDNPFGRNSLKREVAVVNWRRWNITVDLPDLGENFEVRPLNDTNNFRGEAQGTLFPVTPGSYLLVKKGVITKLTGTEKFKNIKLNEFTAPKGSVEKVNVLHTPLNEVDADKPVTVTATIVAKENPQLVSLFVGNIRMEKLDMTRTTGYTYQAVIPKNLVREGYLRYYITVNEQGKTYTFPAGAEGVPTAWDFYADKAYQVAVVPATKKIFLFNAYEDADELSRQWRRGAAIVPGEEPGRSEVIARVEQPFTPDPENRNGEKIVDYSMRYHFGKKISGRTALNTFKKVVIKGRSLNEKPCKVQVAFITRSGAAFGGLVTLQPQRDTYTLNLADLSRVKMAILPRPYPTFLPYYFSNNTSAFSIEDAETLQLSIGPGMNESEWNSPCEVAIECVWLE